MNKAMKNGIEWKTCSQKSDFSHVNSSIYFFYNSIFPSLHEDLIIL